MNADKLLHYLRQPETMEADVLKDLERLLEIYPCFSALRALYLKALSQQNDLRFDDELFRTSLSMPDRTVLYYFIKGETPPDTIATSFSETGIIDAFLGVGDDSSLSESSDHLSVPVYSLEQEYAHEACQAVEPEVEVFLEHAEAEQMSWPAETETENLPALPETVFVGLSELSFTETLANIYWQQKKYDRALEIIKALSLNNPEKSAYFADQIRSLEKIINHLK